jgi:hypothetical protein
MEIEYTREQYANRAIAIFSGQVELVTETFDGSHGTQPTDGTRTSWTLQYPVVCGVEVKVNGVNQTFGLSGDAGKQWYFISETALIRSSRTSARRH